MERGKKGFGGTFSTSVAQTVRTRTCKKVIIAKGTSRTSTRVVRKGGRAKEGKEGPGLQLRSDCERICGI